MRISLRFILPLAVALTAIAYAVVPLVDRLTLNWFVRDLEIRAKLIATATQEPLGALVREPTSAAEDHASFSTASFRTNAFTRSVSATRRASSSTPRGRFPETVQCPATRRAGARPSCSRVQSGPLHVSAHPVVLEGETLGELVIVHDMSFVAAAQRGHEEVCVLPVRDDRGGGRADHRGDRRDQLARLGGRHQGADIGRRAAALARDGARMPELRPIARDLQALVRDLEAERRSRDESQISWGPDALRRILREDLKGDEVLIVSNREPYIHVRRGNVIEIQRPASGLVTALEPVMRACSGTWIAHGSGSADRETVDAERSRAWCRRSTRHTASGASGSPRRRSRATTTASPTKGLWPLCHIAHTRPTFRAPDWEHYRTVNRRFADVVVEEARTENPIVLVQDYHFALLPRMVRERLPRRDHHHFLAHPVAEPGGLRHPPLARGRARRPARLEHPRLSHAVPLQQLLRHRGPLPRGARRPRDLHDLLRRRADRGAPLSDLDRMAAGGARREPPGGGMPQPGPRAPRRFRRNCAWASAWTASTTPKGSSSASWQSSACSNSSRAGSASSRSCRSRRLRARRSTSIRVSRSRVRALATQINDRFGRAGYQPIILKIEHHDAQDVYAYYRAADVCYVSSLHDGMNLVAKEFVAARDDERGVLVLSQFTGAARELTEALIVNPYDIEQCAAALQLALTMPARRAACPHAQHEEPRAGVQRVSLGGAHADRCGAHAPPAPRARSGTRRAAAHRPRLADAASTRASRRCGLCGHAGCRRSRRTGRSFSTWMARCSSIAERPGRSSRRLRRSCKLLAGLDAATGGALALISGRPVAVIDALFAPLRLAVAGQHGIERRDALRDGAPAHVSRRAAAARGRPACARSPRGHAGLLLEDKGLQPGAALPAGAGACGRGARGGSAAALRELGAEFEMHAGKMVIEIKPGGRDKGAAIEEFLGEAAVRGRAPGVRRRRCDRRVRFRDREPDRRALDQGRPRALGRALAACRMRRRCACGSAAYVEQMPYRARDSR